jgi:hypothetical protein
MTRHVNVDWALRAQVRVPWQSLQASDQVLEAARTKRSELDSDMLGQAALMVQKPQLIGAHAKFRTATRALRGKAELLQFCRKPRLEAWGHGYENPKLALRGIHLGDAAVRLQKTHECVHESKGRLPSYFGATLLA